MFGYDVFVLHLLSMIVSHSTVHSHRLCYNISITIPGVFNTYLMHFIHPCHTCLIRIKLPNQGMEDDRQSMGDLSSQLAEALDYCGCWWMFLDILLACFIKKLHPKS